MNSSDPLFPIPKQIRQRSGILIYAAFGVLAACGQPESGQPEAVEDEVASDSSSAPAASGAPDSLTPAEQGQLDQALSAKMTFGTAEEIKALLDEGASPGAENRYGLPVIFTAADRGEVPILEALVAAGAEVNATIGTRYNTDGVGYSGTVDGTPLGYAAAKGRLEAMAFLVQQGADVNGAGPEGTTALMRAAEGLQLEAVQWLLQQGSTAGKDKALALAQQFFNPDEKTQKIIRLLQ